MAKQHSLQWKYRERRGFVIGGGASIRDLIDNGFDFNELVENEVVVGVNKAYRLCEPQFLATIDLHFIRDNIKDLKSLEKTTKIIPNINTCTQYFDEDDPKVFTVTDACKLTRSHSHRRVDIPMRWDQFCYVGGSGLFGLKVAYILGLNPIYLIGFDCKLIDDKSHFHNEYGTPLTDNRLKQFSMNLMSFAETLWVKRRVEVYCCYEDSLLVPRIKYRNIERVLDA